MADEGALAGITVVEQGTGIAAAMCGKAMADLGADVVIVEPPEGSPARSVGPFAGASDPEASGQFLYLNANKRGVVLDLEAQRGRETLKRLASGADIFVTDANPNRSNALGTDYESLAMLNPELVATYVTPFGRSGPYRNYKGTDLIAWHMGAQHILLGLDKGHLRVEGCEFRGVSDGVRKLRPEGFAISYTRSSPVAMRICL